VLGDPALGVVRRRRLLVELGVEVREEAGEVAGVVGARDSDPGIDRRGLA